MTLSGFLFEVNRLAVGLIYISETDGTVSAVSSPRPADSLSQTSFRKAMMLPPAAALRESGYDNFFAPYKDDTDWTDLKGFLDLHLTNQTVFFTTEIEYEVWAVGLFTDEGGTQYIAGIKSNGVAT